MNQHPEYGRYLENIGLFVTYRCEVACAHCLVHAGPHRTETIRDEDAADWMAQAAAYRGGVVKAVNFTGGEPFYDLDALRRLVRMAADTGLFATVSTNAYWAVSPGAALDTLRSLPGLLFLQISADEHHQRQIPFERVVHAIVAAQQLGLVYRVSVCTEDEHAPAYTAIRDRLLAVTDPQHVETVLTFPVGRATSGRLHDRHSPAGPVPEGACAGADSPVIFLDGRVVSCIGPVIAIAGPHPLVLGDLRRETLAEILDRADGNAVLHFIRVWGPGRLYDLLRRRGLGPGLTRLLVSGGMCSLCYRLFSDAGLCRAVEDLVRDPDLPDAIAEGRRRYLGEYKERGRAMSPTSGRGVT